MALENYRPLDINLAMSKEFVLREPRIRLSKNVIINRTIRAEGLDLSPSGMYIYTKTSFAPHSIINLSFILNRKPIEISAEVMHIQQGVGLGVRFTGLEKDAMKTIRNFIKTFAEKIKNPKE